MMRPIIQKASLSLAWGTLAVTIAILFYLLANELWAKSALTGAVIVPGLLLMLISKKRIPPPFLAFYTLVTLMNAICMGWDLYSRVYHIDEVAHFFTSMALAPCLGFFFLLGPKEKLMDRPDLFFLLAFALTFSVGAGWEILEYLLPMEAYYDDTMTDLIADALGAAIGGLLAARYALNERSKITKRDD